MKRLLIVGCGDIAQRVIPLLKNRYRLYALVRNDAHRAALRIQGVTPLAGDLDQRRSLRRLAGLAHIVLHLAPPANSGRRDERTRHLLAALARGSTPSQLVYISTSGVYGDRGGGWVSETSRPDPQAARAQRRLDAETRIREWARRNGTCATILRVPGIYAVERLPLERLHTRLPAIAPEEDSYTNHIHADDLARIIVTAMRRGKPDRIYHASDDSEMKMGDYLDVVADAFQLPRPPRVSRAEAQSVLPEAWLSFLNESRRLTNRRMKKELRVSLGYPTVKDLLAAMKAA